MRILLHECCGPCSLYPLRKLKEAGFLVHGLFYNPNIHPYIEYKARLEALKVVNAFMETDYTEAEGYNLRLFLDMERENRDRCEGCYALRLKKTAEFAKAHSYTVFTTTLLYSRYQKHKLIREIGEREAQAAGVEFYYEDFREGWGEGIACSKELKVYRQKYCGCIFSQDEKEGLKVATNPSLYISN